MEKRHFVNQFGPKDSVDTVFLVKHLAVMAARDGKTYLNVILSDKTGEIEARKWHGAEEVVAKISRGNLVCVKGKVNLFQGKLQIIIDSIYQEEDSNHSMENFVAHSQFAPDIMFTELVGYIEEIQDVYLRDLLRIIFCDLEIARKFKEWPAGKSIHHDFKGGLIEHTLTCVRQAKTLVTYYPVNADYVIAGLMLHDLGKIFELSDNNLSDYTDDGKLLGHLIQTIELVDNFIFKMEFFPRDTKNHLKHILLSHHGEIEFGSPKAPVTSEAMLVHLIDLLDSKMSSFEKIKRDDKLIGPWSQYIKHLDRIVYKEELPTYTKPISKEEKFIQSDSSNSNTDLKQNLGKLFKKGKPE